MMSSNFLRISIVGQMPTGEEWSVNPCWNISDFGVSTTPLQLQTVANALAASAVNSNIPSVMSTSTTLTGYRVEARSYAGVLENQAEAIRTTPILGTGPNPHPFQTAVVVSLRTSQVGPSGRGRLYFPATGYTVSATTLRPTIASTQLFVDGVKTTLASMTTAIRATFAGANLAVWSRKMGIANNVTQLQVGDVLDVQRRRRDTLVEAYQSTNWP